MTVLKYKKIYYANFNLYLLGIIYKNLKKKKEIVLGEMAIQKVNSLAYIMSLNISILQYIFVSRFK